jgi:hypothetical protein
MSKRAPRTVNLSFEQLTDRVVPTAFLSYGEVFIYAGTAPNTVTVTTEYASQTASYDVKVVENGLTTGRFPLSQVTGRVRFSGSDGIDHFQNSTGLRAFADGKGGDDVLVGGGTPTNSSAGTGWTPCTARTGPTTSPTRVPTATRVTSTVAPATTCSPAGPGPT